MSAYFVVHLQGIDDAAETWLSDAAFEHGALGMSEALAFDQPEGEEDVFTRIPDRRAVDVYFAQAPAREFLEELRSRFPQVELTVKTEQERDWLAEWKKSFQPFSLVEDHWVIPSWCEPPPQAKHKIWIDPGMAFGTGTHETTQLVAAALIEVLPGFKAQSLLDVGTGTGILAILARQLGIKSIRGTEIEEEARRVAKENFALNSCADIRLDETQVQDLNETYDVVVANIIDGVLVRLQDALKARVRAGGWLVLSGIIGEREKDFLSGFQLPAGRAWDMRRQKGDWILYALKMES
ncbi:MAG: 50S ribosomal protein L11 methyltransferase [Bdellovibrionales bacterium]|nr:50S ribosomal protein L11 methyltransferase [Bdellovibrionales bacterium]